MFWYRKNGRVYIYTRIDGRQVQVPRQKYRHLDAALDEEIEGWVRQHGGAVGPDRIVLGDDTLGRRLAKYRTYLYSKGRGLDPATADNQWGVIQNYVLPYFVREKGLKDPVTWPTQSYGLFPWMFVRGKSPSLVRETGLALRNLWKWLRFSERVVPAEAILPLETIRGLAKRETPLKKLISPLPVLRFLERTKDPRVRLLVLLSYFFSLRPQETFAVRRGDFLVGAAARKETASKAMKRAGRFADLLVFVERQRNPRVKEKDPKDHSFGWVACFSRLAAVHLISLLNECSDDPDAPLLEGDVRSLYDEWVEARKGTVLDGVTLKDLRRASIHWLGHGPMSGSAIDLRNHARHKDMETTLRYMRTPRRKGPRTKGTFRLDGDDGENGKGA